MKFLVATVLTALLGYTITLFLPWWSFAITSLIVAVAIWQKPLLGFLAGFTGVFVLWSFHAWVIDNANNHVLAPKIGPILHLGESYMTLILVTGFVGGLVSGCAAITGSFAGALTAAPKK
ncbi:hypothetical protein SAMN05421788_1127 [Filimonas lacunae]|uniref:Uncharacterized protein n=1 Tax=Filimonas lacunae TaxID=477680 RepID=A0A173MKM9_9BACT|nr:hypothetical protein [Filimonas lacunae]BAV08205.1 hypothetical protein FLA_4238 [Filimonas lacunae]SIT33026.1 hypothetical protein SAMN05421788_1127 [Filimonas lacunae]